MRSRSGNVQRHRTASCEGKRRFDSFTDANGAAKHAAHNNGEAMNAYHCTFCSGFHIGNPKGEAVRFFDARQPYLVFAHNGDNIECYIGRSPTKDGGKLVEILAKDGWTVTRVV